MRKQNPTREEIKQALAARLKQLEDDLEKADAELVEWVKRRREAVAPGAHPLGQEEWDAMQAEGRLLESAHAELERQREECGEELARMKSADRQKAEWAEKKTAQESD